MTEPADKQNLAASIDKFAVTGTDFYSREFTRIQEAEGIVFSWNGMASIFGPLWGAMRGIWGFFWVFLVLEMFALVQIGRGLWGELGGDKLSRYERLTANIAKRETQAAELLAAGDAAGAESKLKIANNLKKAAETALLEAEAAASQATSVLVTGLLLLLMVKLLEGFYANHAYERQYLKWRSNPKLRAGTSVSGTIWGIVLIICILPLTLIRFTVVKTDEVLAGLTNGLIGETLSMTKFPVGKEYFTILSAYGDDGFDWLADRFGGIFDGITHMIRTVLDSIEILLIGTPWPVVMVVIVVAAFRLAGVRVAIFTAAALAYLAFMGLWEIAMITVSFC